MTCKVESEGSETILHDVQNGIVGVQNHFTWRVNEIVGVQNHFTWRAKWNPRGQIGFTWRVK